MHEGRQKAEAGFSMNNLVAKSFFQQIGWGYVELVLQSRNCYCCLRRKVSDVVVHRPRGDCRVCHNKHQQTGFR